MKAALTGVVLLSSRGASLITVPDPKPFTIRVASTPNRIPSSARPKSEYDRIFRRADAHSYVEDET